MKSHKTLAAFQRLIQKECVNCRKLGKKGFHYQATTTKKKLVMAISTPKGTFYRKLKNQRSLVHCYYQKKS